MALIKCPECGKEVSDKAAACIHCGYPIASNAQHQQEQVVKVLKNVYTPTSPAPAPVSPGISKKFSLFSADNEHVNLECTTCGKIYTYSRTKYFSKVTSDFCIPTAEIRCANCGNTASAYSQILPKQRISVYDKAQLKSDVLRCPKCKSTAVTTGQRGFSIWTGFLGSSKTVNRCGKCGHSWRP